MAGSDGLMLFLLNDCNNSFVNAAFDENLKTTDTYYLLQSVLTSKKFLNFKKLVTNLNIVCLSSSIVNYIVEAENKDYRYCIVLNTTLGHAANMKLSNEFLLNLENNTFKQIKESIDFTLESGDILVVKRRKE